MGSMDKAVLTGFICRLCSEMHRVVIHIYGEEGIRRSIGSKINRYLSINVSRKDPLPKTICRECLERLESQHRLVKCIEKTASILRDRRVNLITEGGTQTPEMELSISQTIPDESTEQNSNQTIERNSEQFR